MKHLFAMLAIFFIGFSSAQAEVLFKAKGEVVYRGLIKVYDASLYVDDRATKDNLLDVSTSRCLKLDYKVSLGKDKFLKAAGVVLQRQHSAQQLEAVQAQIDQLHGAYQAVKKGDTYWMCYRADSQITELRLNDQLLVEINDSADFAAVYMGMWLAENQPISEKLRNTFIESFASNG